MRDDYCRYLPVTINNVSCAAFVDSGNVYRTVISEEFAKQLNIYPKDLLPLPIDNVHTAQKNSALHVLGETKKLLRLTVYPSTGNRDSVTFNIRPAVIRQLGMHVNISGPFLKQHGIDQLHSQDALQLEDGRLLHLMPSIAKDLEPEVATVAVRTDRKIRLPPQSVTHIQAVVPKMVANADGVISGNKRLLDQHGVIPWLSAVVNVSDQGRVPVGIVNPTPRTVVLPRKTLCASLRVACEVQEAEVLPWRAPLCISQVAKTGVTRKPTVQEKLKKIIDVMKEKQQKGLPTHEELPEMPKTDAEKREWLMEKFNLSTNPLLIKPPNPVLSSVVDLLLEFWDVISIQGEYGSTTLLEHEINTGDCPPIKCKQRIVNPYLEPDLKRQINANLAKGVIEPSQSAWSFPLVAAPKRNMTIRWCQDYRRLNLATLVDSFPLPSIEDNLARLSGSTIFSTLDSAGAFHVIPIKKEDRVKTAFSTPWGLFQYKKVPFGLCNGPASYSRLIQLVLHGIPTSMCMPYLDDVIVHSKTLEDHLQHLRTVLEAHRRGGLKLQPSKCKIFQLEVEYLGHIVSGQGIRTIAEYVKVIQDWPLPRTRSDIRIFIGKCAYYRKFIKGFSGIAAPLTDLAGKGKTPQEENAILEPTPAFVAAFKELKKRLLTTPVLAYPRFGKNEPPFILDTDWSQDTNAIGGVLSQYQDGHERVILYGGKKMSKAQRNYSPFKGELAAFLHFVKKWDYYLRGKKFVVRTDHEPLTHIRTMKTPDRHVLRMLAALADLDFAIVYRPGPTHGNADAISRAPHLRDQPDAEEDVGTDEKEDEQRIEPAALAASIQPPNFSQKIDSQFAQALASLQSTINPKHRLSKEALAFAQRDDELLQPVIEHLVNQTEPDNLERQAWAPETRYYWSNKKLLTVGSDQVLRYQRPRCDQFAQPWLLCLPEVLRPTIIRQVHEHGGHCGAEATAQRILRTMFFPRMLPEVKDTLKRCLPCVQKTGTKPKQKGLLRSVVEGYPFQKLSIDYVGPILPPTNGYTYILTVRCTFTKWLEAFPVRAATAQNAISKLVDEVFRRYGVPEVLHSDRGQHLLGKVFQDVAKQLGIQHTTTPSFNPQSNPVERVHRDLGQMLRALRASNGQTWVTNLPAAVMAINTTRHVGTQYSPFQLMFGRDPAIPLTVCFGDPTLEEVPRDQYAREVQERLQSAFRYARKNLKAAVERRRRNYKGKIPHYEIGDKVLLCSPSVRARGKYKSHVDWSGPWTVTKIYSPLTFQITAPKDWNIRLRQQVVSVDRLLHYPDGMEEQKLESSPPDYHEAGDEALERPPREKKQKSSSRFAGGHKDGDSHDGGDSSDGEDDPPPPQQPQPQQQPVNLEADSSDEDFAQDPAPAEGEDNNDDNGDDDVVMEEQEEPPGSSHHSGDDDAMASGDDLTPRQREFGRHRGPKGLTPKLTPAARYYQEMQRHQHRDVAEAARRLRHQEEQPGVAWDYGTRRWKDDPFDWEHEEEDEEFHPVEGQREPREEPEPERRLSDIPESDTSDEEEQTSRGRSLRTASERKSTRQKDFEYYHLPEQKEKESDDIKQVPVDEDKYPDIQVFHLSRSRLLAGLARLSAAQKNKDN
jgi:hypothetical protein